MELPLPSAVIDEIVKQAIAGGFRVSSIKVEMVGKLGRRDRLEQRGFRSIQRTQRGPKSDLLPQLARARGDVALNITHA